MRALGKSKAEKLCLLEEPSEPFLLATRILSLLTLPFGSGTRGQNRRKTPPMIQRPSPLLPMVGLPS